MAFPLTNRASATAFDPFGERVSDSVAQACAASASSVDGDRRARRIGGVVFWSLAAAILAGRIYAADMPLTQQVVAFATQAVALR